MNSTARYVEYKWYVLKQKKSTWKSVMATLRDYYCRTIGRRVKVMKVKCDLCPAVAYGPVNKLIDEGWVRSVIINPVRKTLTRCPIHKDTMNGAIMDLLNGETGEILEKNRIGTFKDGKSGDYEWR